MKRVVIIDYNLGNLFSVAHACAHCGYDAIVSSNKEEISNADALILPGVGAFAKAMQNLKELDIVDTITNEVSSGKPFMGICLGLQLLFEKSDEFIDSEGLGLIKGSVKKFPDKKNDGTNLKVPFIGWNKISGDITNWESTPFKGIQNDEFFYFVHSFYVEPENEVDILSETEYEEFKYCSSVIKDNIFATQFHPEKSGKKGLDIYKNWFEQYVK